ncbi:MAG: Uma2 family endonuclease [Cyanosarcina radialis HA8281-LM2]|jgi:Uma2 family endonuclease|nr:Uma2 family endonuclease [Cyanosarcina radialis HA8281-LM2]
MNVAISIESLTFEKFLAQYGNDARYELIDGELIDLEPTGLHEQVAAFILRKLNVEIDRSDLSWFTPTRCLLKPLALGVAFRPDVIVLDEEELYKEPFWEKEPIVTLGSSVKLAIEVVSTNWQNDYARKVEDYAEMGIPEYWAIDYLGLGGKDYIGYPKQPTLSVYELDDTRPVYKKPKQYRGMDIISSSTFPNLNLTAEKVFSAGR